MDKKELILNSGLKGVEKFFEFAENRLYLTYASTKEILDFFYELERSKGIGIEEFLKDTSLNYGENRKQNTSVFLRHLKSYRSPVMIESAENLKRTLDKIRDRRVKVSCPKNLEGDSFKLEIEIGSETDVEFLQEYVCKNSEHIKKLINIIKRGG